MTAEAYLHNTQKIVYFPEFSEIWLLVSNSSNTFGSLFSYTSVLKNVERLPKARKNCYRYIWRQTKLKKSRSFYKWDPESRDIHKLLDKRCILVFKSPNLVSWMKSNKERTLNLQILFQIQVLACLYSLLWSTVIITYPLRHFVDLIYIA